MEHARESKEKLRMSVNSRLRWRISVAAVFTTLALVLSLSSATVVFAAGEHITQISSDPFTNPDSQHKTEVEPGSFAFGNTIVTAFQQGRFFDGGASGIGFATSTNGGRTFIHGSLPSATTNSTPPNPTYTRGSDASVAFDAKHHVWLISWLGIKNPTGPVDVVVSRSTNGGLTWGAPVAVNASGNFNDKNWTVCDDTPSSPHFGNCYTEYDDNSQGDLEQMSTSTDGGLTWGPGKPTADGAHGLGGQPLVQPNGTVIVPYVGLDSNIFAFTISSFKSTDGGATWSASTLVSEADFHDPNPDGPSGGIRADIPLPSAEIDGFGKVYVAWSDCRFEASCNSSDLVLSTSSDGTTWSPVQRIPIDPVGSGVDHFIPGLAVDRTTAGGFAHLALTFYYFTQANCQLSACNLNVGFISSVNGGKSWSNKELLAGPMKLTWTAQTSQGRMVGDYISTSIVSRDSAFPVFAAARPPTPATLTCGDPGSTCDEATFTTAEGLLGIVGGSIIMGNDLVQVHTTASRLKRTTPAPTAF
jgi:hypothetical protein